MHPISSKAMCRLWLCGLAVLTLLGTGCSLLARAPEGKFEVLDRLGSGGVELRRYPAEVWAVTEVESDFGEAGNKGFRPLFRYISGDNASQQKISMTVPVSQSSSVVIPMTTPVVQTESASGRYEIGFLLPPEFTGDRAPRPNDPKVQLRERPARLVAALRFSGWGRPADVAAREQELLKAVAEHALSAVGPVTYARFNPPITPGFWRRNEVQVEIRETK